MVIRIVAASIGNTIPGGGGVDGYKDVKNAITDSLIGILFLGGAALFLSPLNPVFNSVNIFNLPEVKKTETKEVTNKSSIAPTYTPEKLKETQDKLNTEYVKLAEAETVAQKQVIINNIDFLYSKACGSGVPNSFPNNFTDEMKQSCIAMKSKNTEVINNSGVKRDFLPGVSSVKVPSGYSAKIISKTFWADDGTGVKGTFSVEFTNGSQISTASYNVSYSSQNFDAAREDFKSQTVVGKTAGEGGFIFESSLPGVAFVELKGIN